MLTRNDSETRIHPEEHVVNETWLEHVLGECHGDGERPDVTVTSYRVAKGSETSESVLSDIIAVSVEARINGESKSYEFVVKLLPVDPFSRYFVAEAEFDLREIKFYTEVVPDLERFQAEKLRPDADPVQLPVPKCYLGKYVPFDFSETPPALPTRDKINESIIVMENLKKRGYRNVSFTTGLTLGQAESALAAIAKVHALSVAMKVHEKQSLMDKYDFLFRTEKTSLSYQQLMERGFPQLTLFLDKRPDMGPVIESLNGIRPKMKHLIDALLKPREPMSLITHTDFWSNNLLFGEDTCAILDWQMVTYSRPTNDLALLIISSLPSETRRGQTAHLLDVYWTTLTTVAANLSVDVTGDLGYGRDDLTADYKSSQLLALLLCIGSIDVALRDPNIEQRLIDVLTDLHETGVLTPDFVNSL